ncbi:MAG: methyltransferase domain-containing protein, partial [Planctomycetaceae bacterium]|nr:methyltransferase domain-containing protein [Planctomycetaceae bacterium]
QILVPLLALTAVLSFSQTRSIAGRITSFLSEMEDLLIWEHSVATNPWSTAARVSVGLAMTLGMMVVLWEIFMPIGRILGRSINDATDTIRAYSINVVGSLIGIWLFVMLSSLWLPPVVWILTACVLLAAFMSSDPTGRRTELKLLAAMIGVSLWGTATETSPEIAWSPYQKLELEDLRDQQTDWVGQYLIKVNNAGYQGIIDLSADRPADPRVPERFRGYSQYDIPFRFHSNPQNVLIVGAGSGNDVAGALRNGAGHVTAVEIDPAIIDMGRRYHPERPYDSANVDIVNDDARSFFATTEKRYDLIVFGLLDSHTTTAMTNARLDHYVYTRESISRAKSLLNEGGVIALSFEALKPYIADRMEGCLREVFGQPSLMFRVPANPTGWGGVMFVTGDMDRIDTALHNDAPLNEAVTVWQNAFPVSYSGNTRIATDDWPYIYLESPRIPRLYFLLAGLMPILLVYAQKRTGAENLIGRWTSSEWHFALLGAAFLLLEVQNISKASVVMGNTWLVNAVVISGILCMILMANSVARRFPTLSRTVVGTGLLGSCLLLYVVDLSTFAFLPYAMKALVVGGLTTIPLMFSGIIFAQSFLAAESKPKALGANLLGSIVGGMLQSLTFIFGIKALLLIVAGMYAAALWTAPIRTNRRSDADSENSDAHHGPDAETIQALVQSQTEQEATQLVEV